MGRRRSRRNSNSFIDLLIGGAFLGFFAILAAVVILAMVGLTILVYAVPLLLLGTHLYFRKTPTTLPALPQAADYDPQDESERLETLYQSIRRLRRLRLDIYRLGESEGLDFRAAGSGEWRRFSERSRKGKDLNRKLDDVDSMEEAASTEVGTLRCSVSNAFPDWTETFKAWRRARASALSIQPAVTAYGGGFVIGKIMPLFWDVSRLKTLMLIDLLPHYLYAPAAAGGAAAAAVFAFVWWRQEKALRSELNPDFIHAWIVQYEKWLYPWNVEELDNDDPAEDEPISDMSPSDDQKSWFDILGVSPDATVDTIKSAWREQIKKYHPDQVANLGPKLKALAEEETKALNAALQEAMRVRGA